MHVAHPQRIEENQEVGRRHPRLHRCDDRRRNAVLEILLGTQQRKVQRRDVQAIDRMPATLRPAAVGLGQRVAEVAAGGIGVPLDDQDSRAHRLLRGFLFTPAF